MDYSTQSLRQPLQQQMRQLRNNEMNLLAHSHTTSKLGRQDPNPGSLTPNIATKSVQMKLPHSEPHLKILHCIMA